MKFLIRPNPSGILENYFVYQVEKDHLSNRGLECFLRMFQSPAILHDHEHPIKDLDLKVLSQNAPIKVLNFPESSF